MNTKQTIDLRNGDYREVLANVSANLIFTSPPYNIGSKCERKDGQRKHGCYDPKSFGAIRDYFDEVPEKQYQESQVGMFLWAEEHLADGGTLVYNHKPRRRNMRMIHPAEWFLRQEVREKLILMEEVIWLRGSTHNHGRQMMWPTTERLYVFKRAGGGYALNNTAATPQRSDVWKIAPAQKTGHNAPFPLALATAVIEAWSKPGDTVCDPYTGSGTTAVAARECGRRFVGAEIEVKYWRLATENLQK